MRKLDPKEMQGTIVSLRIQLHERNKRISTLTFELRRAKGKINDYEAILRRYNIIEGDRPCLR